LEKFTKKIIDKVLKKPESKPVKKASTLQPVKIENPVIKDVDMVQPSTPSEVKKE
jgi:hypothetical protein